MQDDAGEPAYGGPWTVQKLGCVEEYLKRWAQVMKNQTQWRTRYIDAFSGTGRCALRGAPAPDMEEAFNLGLDLGAVEEQVQVLDGSVTKALEIVPPFDRLDLIELDPAKAHKLRALQTHHVGQRIEVHEEDANAALLRLCSGFDRARERGVLFLDPFGCQVTWETLSAVAATQAIDVWYLFPAGWINRMLTRRPDHIPPGWRTRITACLGTEEWLEEFYRPGESLGLFDDPDDPPETTRIAGPLAVERFFRERLAGLFEAVAEDCVRLKNRRNSHMYSLCFAVANPSQQAIGAALRIANHIIKKWDEPRRDSHGR